MLCDAHHRLVHEHGWTITGTPSTELRFTRPGCQPPKPYDGDIERLIANATGPIAPILHGDRFNLSYVVSTIIDRAAYLRAHQPVAVATIDG